MENPLSKEFSFKKYFNRLNRIGCSEPYSLEAKIEITKKIDDLLKWLIESGMKICKKMHYPAYISGVYCAGKNRQQRDYA
jgi:hypothetical protein